MTRAAIYARYSSDNQREASIDDQVRICSEFVSRQGWSPQTVYSDHALSGATTLRPGYQRLLEDARAGRYDVLVAESLDRLSRDQADVATLYKLLSFCGVRIVTIAEGEISELHVGLKGTMNALYLKDLAQKTRRGLEGRVRAGRSGGGLCYGYDVVHEIGPDGQPVFGKRDINPAEADVVRRIFTMFAAGSSPRVIAKRLNQDGIPGPRGQALAGHRHPRACDARHRDPQQRALRRADRLEPPHLRQRSDDEPPPLTAQSSRTTGSCRRSLSSASSTTSSGRRSRHASWVSGQATA